MTSKKAASFCIAVGTAMALFAAAAGLNRPTDPAARPSTELQIKGINLAEIDNAGTTPTETPVKVLSAPMSALEGHTAVKPVGPEQPAPAQQQAQPAPARAQAQQDQPAEAEADEPASAERALTENRTTGRRFGPLDFVSSDGRTAPALARETTLIMSPRDSVLLPIPPMDFGDAPMPRDFPACIGIGNQNASQACGEEAFHNDGDADTVAQDGYGIVGVNVRNGLIQNQIITWTVDDGSLNAAATICGATIGVGSNNTGLHRFRLRVYPVSCGATCNINPTGGTPVIDVAWCGAGAPEPPPPDNPDVFFLFFPTTQFAPVSMNAGAFSYLIGLDNDFPLPNGTNENTGVIIASPGYDEATGTFPQTNGNLDNLAIIGDGGFFQGGLGFGGNTYAGFFLLLHTTDFYEGKTGPDRSSTTGGNETAPVACDIAAGSVVANCLAGPNGAIDDNDAGTLANLIVANIGIQFPGGAYEAARCADVDRNGRIDCNDWRTFAALCGSSLAVPASMSSPLPGLGDPIYGNITCQPNVAVTFSTGGSVPGAPIGEVAVTLPFDLPDNNITGRTNTQVVAPSGSNGIGDIDVDLDITHGNNSDLVVRLIHSNISRTIVNQPLGRIRGPGDTNGFTGLRALLDDGEQDGSNPPGGAITGSIRSARSSFRVFGRYKPSQALSLLVGRVMGGAGNATGTGLGDYRLNVSDRSAGDTGIVNKWSLHIRLGPIISGIIDGGTTVDNEQIVDKFRTLGCRPIASAGSTYFTFGQPGGIDTGNPLLPLPAGFFDVGSNAFTGTISFEGVPLEPFSSDADMILRRLGNIQLTVSGACTLPFPPNALGISCGYYRSKTMNLKSCSPIQVTYVDRSWPEFWNVNVFLNEVDQPDPGGTITLYPNGAPDLSSDGRYWASLSIIPTFRFSQYCDPAATVDLDTLFAGIQAPYFTLDYSTGAENPANPTPGCAGPTPSSCRIPYVNDPNRSGAALGANPVGIVPGDASFVPNVNAGTFTRFDSQFQARDLGNINRNWHRIGVRAPAPIPGCPSVPASAKDLPCELVRGTWGFGGVRVALDPSTGACQIPVIGTGSTLGALDISDCRALTGNSAQPTKRMDRFTLANPILLGQVRWVGGYLNSDYNLLGAPQNNVEDPPLGPNFLDAFTIEIWPDLPAQTPPRPDTTGGPLLTLFVGAGADRIPRTGLPGLPADLSFVVTGNTVITRVYEYVYNIPFGGEPTIPAGNWWVTIYNNTNNTTPAFNNPTTGFGGFWWWPANIAGGLGTTDSLQYRCNNTNINFNNRRNQSFCLSFAQLAQSWCGTGVDDPTCSEPRRGLGYSLLGSNTGNGTGTGLINGATTFGLSGDFVKDLWLDVGTAYKNNATDGYKFSVLAPPEPLPLSTAGVTRVTNELNTLLGAKAPDLVCRVNSLIASLPSTGSVERVFAGKLDFDGPSVTGNIEQVCRQADGSEYGGPANTLTATFALKNNLDTFGIGLTRTLTSNFPDPGTLKGQAVFYVCPQAKDCNDNGRDDSLDIQCGLDNVCGGLPGSGDCNGNGTPDECEVPPIGTAADCDGNLQPDDPCQIPNCLGGNIPNACLVPPVDSTYADCDGDLVPDVCQTDCDNNGVIDPCELPPVASLQTDCDGNLLPDNCETQGAFVAPLGTPPGSTVAGGVIDFEAPYTLGVLQAGLPTSGPTGTGQQGWKVIIGTEVSIPGFGGATPTLYPSNSPGPSIVAVPFACTQPSFLGQMLEIPRNTAVGSHGVWSWGVLSPKMRNRTQGYTRFEIDMYVEPSLNENDFHNCVLISDAGPGFPNPSANPIPVVGISVARISNADLQPTMYMWASSPSTGTIQVVSFGDLVPEGTCVKWRIEVDGVSPVTGASARYYIDRTGSGANFEFLRQSRPMGIPFGGPIPIRVAIGTANNTNGTDRKVWWDNPKFEVGTPFDFRLATCGGSGTRNGCRILAGEPDCNCNGVPDACDVGPTCVSSAGTAAITLEPVTTQSATTTRPCSDDCNSNGIPDECEVGERARDVVMYHNFEQTASPPPPFFTPTGSIVGQPTADPLVAPFAPGDPTANGNPSWFVPVVPPNTLPDLFRLQISNLHPCPSGPGNDQSIGIFIDPSRAVDGTGAYTLRSATFNKPIQAVHRNKNRFTVDMKILPGRSTYQVRPIGDDPGTTVFARFSVQRVRFARAGQNYPDDFTSDLAAQGYLPTNQIQIPIAGLAGGGLAFVALKDPVTNNTLQWPNNQCFRLIVESDACKPTTPPGEFLDQGMEIMVGIDLNFDDVPETSVRVGSLASELIRGVDLITDNVASGDPSAPGSAFFDNVRIWEIDDYCDSPACTAADGNNNGIPDVCEVPACATCPGDMNGDNQIRGNDIQAFVACYLGGNPSAPGCACADMAGPGGAPPPDGSFTAVDVTRFVDKLLRRGGFTLSPACEP